MVESLGLVFSCDFTVFGEFAVLKSLSWWKFEGFGENLRLLEDL